MAKNKRFPSPANQKPGAAKAAPGPLPEKPGVSGVKQDLVVVHYKKKNTHVLGIGAHSIAEGVNSLPKSVWAEAQKHPSVQQLIKDGHLAEVKPASSVETEAGESSEEESDDAETSDDGEGSEGGDAA